MTQSPEQEKIRALEAQVANLTRENTRLRAYLETATDLSIVLDKHGRYHEIFAAANNNGLLVQPAAEVIGLTMHDVFPEQTANQFLALIRAALDTGQTQTLTYAAETLSGSRWFSGQIRPLSANDPDQEALQDLVLSIIQDITQQKRLAEDLQTSQDRFRFLADSAAVGIFESDLSGQIHYVNQAFADILGYASPDEVIALGSFKHYKDSAARQQWLAYLRRDGLVQGAEVEFLTKAGEVRTLLFSVALKQEHIIGTAVDITERNRYRQQLRLITDSLPILISYIDAQRRYQFVNRGYEEWFGVRREDLLGQNVYDIVGSEAYDVVADDLSRALAGEDVSYERAVPYKTGIRYTRARLMPHRTAEGEVVGVFTMVDDITDRKEAELALHASKEKVERHNRQLTTLYEIGQALATLDTKQIYRAIYEHLGRTIFNAPHLVVAHYDEEQALISCGFAIIDGQEMSAELFPVYSLGEGPTSDTIRTRRPQILDISTIVASLDGKKRHKQIGDERQTVSSLYLPLINHGRVIGVINLQSYEPDTFEDSDLDWLETIASQCAAALMNAQLFEQAQTTLNDLENANRELQNFAYIASHDLQEPLRMVTRYLQLLQKRYDNQLDERAQQYIFFAVDGAQRMTTLIKDLLAYSRLATDTALPEAIDLNEALALVLHDLSVTIEEKQAVVTAETLPTVWANASQMRQLLQNLIANALKFQREDVPPRIQLTAVASGREWIIAIQDNGIGIAPNQLEQIFVIFRRLHTRQEYPGTGIGLAICKRILERHHGRIWAESVLGEGSTFYIALPAS